MTRLRIEAPADWSTEDIAQAVLGERILLKAENRPSRKHKTPFLAMQQLDERVVAGYEFILKRMVEAIREYIEKEILHETLDKADLDRLIMLRPLLTHAQLEALEKIIKDHHLAAVAGLIHPSLLTLQDFQRLTEQGLISQDLKYVVHPKAHEKPPERVEFTDVAYDFGRSLIPVTAYERDKGPRPHSYELPAFERARVSQPPHSTEEKHAMEWARRNAGMHIRNLGASIAHDVATAISEEDAEIRKRYVETVKDKTTENIKRRESWRKLASEIGHATGDWSKGLGRIAATERSRAVQEGTVAGLKEREKKPAKKIFVARVPTPDACDDCVRLHLTAGRGSKPKIFPLSQLEANGSNVGRKRAQWKAVVGPAHPWCFPPGTSICVEGGHVSIESIRVGDLVRTHTGKLRAVLALSAREYLGDLIVLTVGNETLKLTPEHPLFTARGWVAAQDIQPGDSLFKTPELSLSSAHADNLPAETAQERFLGSILASLSHGGMPAWVYLNDGADIRETYVGAEYPNRELWRAVVAGLVEGVDNQAFVSGDRRILLAGLRRLELLAQWPVCSTDRSMRILGEAASLFGASACGDDELLLASASYWKTSPFEAKLDSAAAYTVALGQFLDTIARAVSTNAVFDWDAFSKRHVVAYSAATVVSTAREAYKGTVHNFSVAEDQSYVANGFAAHNCECGLVNVPDGWEFDDDGRLMPIGLKRSEFLEYDLLKSETMTYGDSVPLKGVAIRIGDPLVYQAVEAVVKRTPIEVFDKRVGVTLITTDSPRSQNPLEEHDFAYWTANEIRIMQSLSADKIARVLPHEIGHSLNVYLLHQLGTVAEVRAWHAKLWKLSEEEGFVSDYAKNEPIENAAEVTMMYLYERKKLMLSYPRQFAFCHEAYRDIFRRKKVTEDAAE